MFSNQVPSFESYQNEKTSVLSAVWYLLLFKTFQLGKMCPPFWYICFASHCVLAVRMFITLPAPDRQHLYLQVPGSFPHLLPFSEPVANHWEVHDGRVSEIQQQQWRWDHAQQLAGRTDACFLSLDLRVHTWGAPCSWFARWLLAWDHHLKPDEKQFYQKRISYWGMGQILVSIDILAKLKTPWMSVHWYMSIHRNTLD